MTSFQMYEYWKMQMDQDIEMWEGNFLGKPMTEESIYLQLSICNPYSNQLESSWVIYPNVYAALGFITYIFLPTALAGFLIREPMDADYVHCEDFKQELDQWDETKVEDGDVFIPFFKDIYADIHRLWESNSEECYEGLKKIGEKLKAHPMREYEYFLFSAFDSHLDVSDYVISRYEEDEMLGLEEFEKDFGMSKGEWLNITKHAMDNAFMSRKFAQLLTNSISHIM
ncbi:hypothetical protein [Alteribacillus iranensis]|uniref:Uncharacterized protein n=1 Tax=Alteribacillus iranensis TaxID=930128 RepID=A0A1I2D5H7_9BACI|nr:hypothetical protein [Alteribacillus iranensis]SFE75230.1 hypothetical protein SAMN05192532_103393 [Alteribacillus iranensis]